MTTNGLIDRATGGHVTHGDSLVLPGDVATLQRLDQMSLGRNGLGDHHQPRGVLVQTMDDTSPRHLGNFRVPVQQGIEHGAIRGSSPRVDDQAGRFIDHQDVVIFVDDVELDILRLPARLLGHFGVDQHLLTGHDAFPRQVDDLAIQLDLVVQDPLLDPGSGVIRKQIRQRLVQTFAVMAVLKSPG